jgi:hypothetical protein
MPAAKPVLRVFVAKHCLGCEEARRIAREAQARFSDLRVEVVDLDGADATVPPEVFATPTYLLDGKVVSLGNPTFERLSDRLTEYLEARGGRASSRAGGTDDARSTERNPSGEG